MRRPRTLPRLGSVCLLAGALALGPFSDARAQDGPSATGDASAASQPAPDAKTSLYEPGGAL